MRNARTADILRADEVTLGSADDAMRITAYAHGFNPPVGKTLFSRDLTLRCKGFNVGEFT